MNVNLLKKIVNIPSYTGDRLAINKVNNVLAEELKKIGLRVALYSKKPTGNLLVAKSDTRKSRPKILFSGHSDIVQLPSFSKFRSRGDKYYGSGVADMKGGLVVMIEVLRELKKMNKLFNITCVINPDEETGSQAYKPALAGIYKLQDYAFVFEPALEINKGNWQRERWLVTKRRGVIWLDMTIKGKGGHAGNDKIKESPIVEMSKKIVQWNALNNPRRGVSVNVGKIWGGKEANIIPTDCTCRLDIRTNRVKVRQDVLDNVIKILGNDKQRLQSFYKIIINEPPLEENEKTKFLKKKAKLVWRQKDLKFINVLRGGGSDANQIAVYNVGVLDGLGPVGSGIHTDNEWVYKDSFTQSIELVSSIINMVF